MDLKSIKWNKTNYQEFINYLKKFQDINYKTFHSKIVGETKYKIIGIKVPILKKIAKEISKGDYINFFKENNHKYYEEVIIHGLILGYIKVEEEKTLELLNNFIKYIDNWATCDTTCSNLKKFKKININKLNKYLKSNNPWEVRVGVVILLNHYIEKENLDYIFDICDKTKIDHYYVKMAISWLISFCYIKYPEKTIKYLKNNKLDTFTQNKAISKICDSYRVGKEEKNEIKKLKI
ncbi:MAG: DNA alkylation repair protein [Bacilli bacterium]|nr:DNA alkylation repair protein [Bacilli bacterium]